MNLGPTELLIILLIVILLFGVGRLSKIGREMGSGIREFKQGLQGDEEKEKGNEAVETTTSPPGDDPGNKNTG
jgi:sec-independent protein translocase protein TatA